MGIIDGGPVETAWLVFWDLGAKRRRTWVGFNVAAPLAELTGIAEA